MHFIYLCIMLLTTQTRKKEIRVSSIIQLVTYIKLILYSYYSLMGI